MPLPALTGDIILNDKASDVFRQVATGAATADRALTEVQQEARRLDATFDSLSAPQIAAPAASSRGALQAASQERVRQAQVAATQLATIEQGITQNTIQESTRRLSVEQQTAAARRRLVQDAEQRLGGPAPATDALLRQLAEVKLRAKETGDALKSSLNADTSITGRLDQFIGQRAGAIRNEAAQRNRVAADTAAQVNNQERRITQATESESQRRRRVNEQENKERQRQQAGGLGGIGAGLTRGAAALGIGLGIRELGQQVVELTTLGTQAERAHDTFVLLSGGEQQAADKLEAIVHASGGAINELTAMNVANKAAALGLAKTSEELDRVTKFATISGRILGLDTVSALDNLAAAAANLSFERLDQMGVSSTAVREKMKQLQAQFAGMSREQAFLEATLSVGEQTFRKLADSSVASASGLEIFGATLKNARVEVGKFAEGNLDTFFRDLAVQIGGGQLEDVAKTIEARAARLRGLADTIGDTLSQAGRLPEFNLLSDALRQAAAAQTAGVANADDFAAAVEGIARAFVSTNDLTEEQVVALQSLIEQYGIGTGAALAFQAAQGQTAQTQAIDEIAKRLENLRAKANTPLIGSILADPEEIKELEDILATAQANAAKGIPITVDPRVEGLVAGEILKALPDTGVFDELQAAEQRLIDTSTALASIQEQAAGGEAATAARTQTLQLAKEIAQADVNLAQAKRDVITAQLAYGQALEAGNAATTEAAQADLQAAQTAVQVADARKSAIVANEQVKQAEAALQAAQRGSEASTVIAAQSALQLATARKQQAQATLATLTGEGQVATAADQSASAYKEYAKAMSQLQRDMLGLVDAQTGLPVAFNASTIAGEQLSPVLQQLAADVRGLATAAQQSAFGLARGLIPQLGVAGALGVGQQFQEQAGQVVQAFNTINSQRIDQGKSPLNPQVLDAALSATGQWQQAFVSDMQQAQGAAESAAKGSQGAWEQATKAMQDAIDGITSGVIAPTTEGLIPADVMEQLLPREDAVDEGARHMADVAVNGFNSQFFEGLKAQGLFPQPLLDQGEQAIRQAAARMVQAHTEGLTGMFIDVDKAAEKVVERIQGTKNIDATIAQIREKVEGLADVSNLDIKEALGIDTTAERIGASVKSAFGNLPQTFEGLLEQISQLFADGTEGQTSPIATALTVTPEQQAGITTGAQGAMTTAGEAMVTQATDGNYGGRAIDNIIAAIEAKKAEIEKSGKQVADWLGKSLTERFRDSVPAELLRTLVTELVPLMTAAAAANQERTAGAGVQ